jgi:hypothetical protein
MRHEARTKRRLGARARRVFLVSRPRRSGVSEQDAGGARLQELLAQLDTTLAELEAVEDSADAVERLTVMAELAREVQAEIDRLRREGDAADAPA